MTPALHTWHWSLERWAILHGDPVGAVLLKIYPWRWINRNEAA